MRELGLSVTGMESRRCVRDVTARLRDVPGVETVVVDTTRSHIRLTGSMTVEDVLAALADTTYEPSLAERSSLAHEPTTAVPSKKHTTSRRDLP